MSKTSSQSNEIRRNEQINIDHLIYYIEFCSHMNFTKAADILNISQPGLSRAIRSLEDQFGTTLVDRTTRVLRLTSEGELLHEHGKKILEQFQTEISHLSDMMHSEEGIVRLGIPDIQGSVFLPNLFKRFRMNHPKITLELIERPGEYIKKEVIEGKLDLGLIMMDINQEIHTDDSVSIEETFCSRQMLAVSEDHSLRNVEEISITQLQGEKFILLSKDFSIYQNIIYYCKQAGFEPNIEMTSSQWDFLLELVGLNCGVTILPKPILERFAPTNVHLIELVDPVFPWNSGVMVLKKKYLSNSVKTFIKELRIEAEEWRLKSAKKKR